jgi:hypothetical protein
MTWESNEEALDAFDRLVTNSMTDLHRFMTIVHENGLFGETPPELLVRVIANFFHTFVQQRENYNILDSLTMTKSIMMSDPVLHYLVEMNLGDAAVKVVEE